MIIGVFVVGGVIIGFFYFRKFFLKDDNVLRNKLNDK